MRRELSTLRAEAAESAGKHLVMVARLLDEEPEAAYAHAETARKHGPRVAVIREALGIAAYRCGKYAEALAELRAARRISGNQDHWPMMADCERALGRPDKALQMAAAPEVAELTRAGQVEMRIVAAGARSDLGQLDAAVVTLQSPELTDPKPSEWGARLRFAYAAALEAVGRHDEARAWFARAAEADPEGLTDAAERLAELDGVVFLPDEDLDEDELDDVEASLEIPVDAPVEAPVQNAVETAAEIAVEAPVEAPDDQADDQADDKAVDEPVAAEPEAVAEPVEEEVSAGRVESPVEFAQTALVFEEPIGPGDARARADG